MDVPHPTNVQANVPGLSVTANPIDRQALVTRHRVVLTTAGGGSPLSVGNGTFCFTADITGLQTFADEYRRGIPLTTMSDWGWHHQPNPLGYTWTTFPLTMYHAQGRQVGYLYHEVGISPAAHDAAAAWLYADPSRMHLGRIGMVLTSHTGRLAEARDLSAIHQELDPWTGVLASSFRFDGEDVRVTTVCHGRLDQLAVTVESPLVGDGRLRIEFVYPYASHASSGDGAIWDQPLAHQTAVTRNQPGRIDLVRTLDRESYASTITWEGPAQMIREEAHRFRLAAAPGVTRLACCAAFAPAPLPEALPDAAATRVAAAAMWQGFWTEGGAIDLSLSRDPRWFELERRIILSRYLTRINSAGTLPPQESGLTMNTWHGKFHLEMTWWHLAHFALWGKQDLIARIMPFYQRILPIARQIAQGQGYAGARWPKCVGPEGTPVPTYLEAFLLWQQPNPIFLAELCYRADLSPEVLARYREIIDESARFMASFATWNDRRGAYEIGPPATDAAEIYYQQAATNQNLNLENAAWHFGLEIAQRWRERLGQAREPAWDAVLSHLPPLAQRDGVYVAGETQTGTWDPGKHWSHPDILAPLGMLDGALADHAVMRATLSKVFAEWDWPSTWGWDFPEVALCAARLGDGKAAVDALLMPEVKNTYLANGHNWQVDSLPVYLPGNGGLLYAVAMMAAGWDGAPPIHAPGFPQDGSWVVRWEGLRPAPADYRSPASGAGR